VTDCGRVFQTSNTLGEKGSSYVALVGILAALTKLHNVVRKMNQFMEVGGCTSVDRPRPTRLLCRHGLKRDQRKFVFDLELTASAIL